MDVGLFVIAFAHQTAFFRQATGPATAESRKVPSQS